MSKMGEMQNARPVEAIRPDTWPKIDFISVRHRRVDDKYIEKLRVPRRFVRRLFILKLRVAFPVNGSDEAACRFPCGPAFGRPISGSVDGRSRVMRRAAPAGRTSGGNVGSDP